MIGILQIDQDLKFASRLSERFTVMNRGVAIAQGAPEFERRRDMYRLGRAAQKAALEP